jgi:hypothetical protein
MLSIVKRLLGFYKPLPKIDFTRIGEDISKCQECRRLLQMRYNLRFLSHAVEIHKYEHDAATEILERIHRFKFEK